MLEQDTGQSAFALRKLLGLINFEPIYPDIGKPDNIVKTSLNALAIVTPLTDLENADNGADSYLWWAWTVRIRTIAKIPIEVNLLNTAHQPVYQKIANTSLHLRELGFSNRKIAECLSVDEQTVAKAIQWINSD